MVMDPLESVQQVLTGHNFADEQASMDYFDAKVEWSGAFRIYKEVCGEFVQPRIGAEQKGLRVDRILIPQTPILDAGWNSGAIIVEGKRSSVKLGKCVAQAQDYARAAFTLPRGGVQVMAKWVFLWPLEGEPKGDVGSLMAQSRIGWVSSSARLPLVFGCGAMHGISILHDRSVVVKPFPMGAKAGNRG